mgnify:CR=1 FL=1
MARNLGQKTERRILKKIGAHRQPASGAIPGLPNDGIKNRYLLEVKSTQRKSLGIKREWLESLEENATARSKVPALLMILNRVNSVGSFSTHRMRMEAETAEWVAIPLRDFERLTKGWARS